LNPSIWKDNRAIRTSHFPIFAPVNLLQKLFGKKDLPPVDMALVGVDMHSHLIPGIDDGAPNMDISLELIRGFSNRGYRKIITTPHIMSDHYRNTPEIILSGLEKVKKAIAEEGLNIEIDASAEYYIDDGFMDLLKRKELLYISEKYLLVEMGFMAAPPMLKEVFFELQMMGKKPILAHPERYVFWHRDLRQFHDLHDREVLLQLNINSLSGIYSPEVKRVAEYLIEQNLVSLIGSDCHHPGHLQMMDQARCHPLLHQLIHSGRLINQKL